MHVKRVLVNGAWGFIGGHLEKRLKAEGCWVRGVELKRHEFAHPPADEFVVEDLREPAAVKALVSGIDEIYQLAARSG